MDMTALAEPVHLNDHVSIYASCLKSFHTCHLNDHVSKISPFNLEEKKKRKIPTKFSQGKIWESKPTKTEFNNGTKLLRKTHVQIEGPR